ncbi:MAG: amylo-alpha-1,6-glucosidase [Actinomycetota bacterium]|nr:amylo-alpha-1,6-glucosidase [Actinomycetota bacterium]
MISFVPSDDLVLDPSSVVDREWLSTNGIGGYASGTIAGVLTRRYHGLLVAALDPPLGRTVLVTKIDDSVSFDGEEISLFANQRVGASSSLELDGFRHLTRFHLDGATPVWSYGIDGVILEKRVWMEPGQNTTYVRYEYRSGSRPLRLDAKILVNHRDFHQTTRSGDWPSSIEELANGVRVDAFDGAAPTYVLSDGATIERRHEWCQDYYLSVEAFRGLDTLDDNLYAAHARASLTSGDSVTLVLSTEPDPQLDGEAALAVRKRYEADLVARASTERDDLVTRLVLAADQFIVERSSDGEAGSTVIAGYHWFGDWGRDTMIALPGLTLATGRHDEARQILRTFAHHVDHGMLPNRFPDDGERPEYNTIDATLWFFEAIRAFHADTADVDLVAELFPVLADIVGWHQRGTRYGIRVDPVDGLLAGGEPGVQLTWMDAKVDDWVVTPRIGKPVEINALWYNALRIMTDFAEMVGEDPAPYAVAADTVRESFDRFWNEERGFCFDVIEGPDGDDAALRPNQLFAASLFHSPLPLERQRAVVDACTASLLTPLGLRTLGPDEPEYRGRYGGGLVERDGAYHQGTVWPWLIGPFADAHLRVYQDQAAIEKLLEPFIVHLGEYGMGTIAECAEGDPPHDPRATIAQAWSVAEVMRVLRRCRDDTSAHGGI